MSLIYWKTSSRSSNVAYPEVTTLSGPNLLVALSRQSLERLIRATDPRFFAGLHRVVLIETGKLTSRSLKRHSSRPGATLLGSYHAKSRTSEATIEVFVDAIFRRRPDWAWKLSILRDLYLSRVFFHELGHHVAKAIEPSSGDMEAHAEKWRKQLSRAALQRRYGPLLLLARPIAWALRWVSRLRRDK